MDIRKTKLFSAQVCLNMIRGYIHAESNCSDMFEITCNCLV